MKYTPPTQGGGLLGSSTYESEEAVGLGSLPEACQSQADQSGYVPFGCLNVERLAQPPRFL